MPVRRRYFLGSGAALATALPFSGYAATALSKPRRGKPVLMKTGTQDVGTEDDLVLCQRYGIRNVGGIYKIKDPDRHYPTVDELNELKAMAGKYGVAIDLVDTTIGRGGKSAIMLGKSPDRDREIEDFQNTIKSCAAAGIPILKYYLSALPIIRTSQVPGRGDTTYNRFSYDELLADGMQTLGPPVPKEALSADAASLEEYWARVTYFLDRVVPVANHYKVKIAQHPHDPGLPPQGYLGIPNFLGTVEGLKRFVAIQDSPYHGLNFCQGTLAEMLDNPNEELPGIVRYFGVRKKIFNVHFRNIRGHRFDLIAEVFPDDGDVDFPAIMQVYREIGYDGMMMPDHVPGVVRANHTQDELKQIRAQLFVYAYGYINGLIQSAGLV